MKPFTSVVLATFLAAVATLGFEQSAKADVIIRYDRDGNIYSRQYHRGYRGNSYQIYRPRYRVYRKYHYRPRIKYRSIRPRYRVDYRDYYPRPYRIRYRYDRYHYND
ncbi:hypothetical protein [Fischerella sp. PCC 9605]|uniref:hypothetical protein n=1 Tax=Fischerella sp. PCC 9605 TaxID=1173024 RepID=UPI0004789583|nr:hypothetical protein [Fischerella sp. PCC 9605]